MADSKLTALTADATPTSDDLTYVVNDPAGTPGSKKVTLANAITKAHGLSDSTVVGVASGVLTSGTDVAVVDGGTGRSTGTNAYALIATGTTATGAQQTLAAGATTEVLVGGGAAALPVWTTAQGSGAPVRATSPTLTTPVIGAATGTSLQLSGLTASEILITDASKNLASAAVATYPSLTELAYVKGVTSALQTQINAKEGTLTNSAGLAAALSDETGTGLAVFNNSPTFVDDITVGTAGVATGDILIKGTTSGTVTLTVNDVAGTPTYVLPAAVGASGTFLKDAAGDGVLSWAAPAGAGTVTNTGGDLTANAVVLGAGTTDTKVVAGIITDGTSVLTLGVNATTIGKVKMFGNTSGDATIQPSAAAGTATVLTLPASSDTLVGKATTDTLTNKTFDADGTGNSITNIENADIKAAAAIAVNKLAALTVSELVVTDGSGFLTTSSGVSATEAGYLNGVTSAIQTQLDARLPLAGGTMTGNITLGENTSVALDPAGSADGKYSGITVAGTAGEALAFGDVIVLDVTAGKWFKGSVSAAAAADGDLRGGTGMCVLAAAGDASATTVLLSGTCRADANFPALTIGSVVYASTTGDITSTRPSTTDHVIKVLGFALTADEIMFAPSMDYMTQV